VVALRPSTDPIAEANLKWSSQQHTLVTFGMRFFFNKSYYYSLFRAIKDTARGHQTTSTRRLALDIATTHHTQKKNSGLVCFTGLAAFQTRGR
jgi:hypothetical protein